MGLGAELLMETMIDKEIDAFLLRAQRYEKDCELFRAGLWRMRNGKLIEISKMSSNHLRNTIAMITRNKPKYSETYWKLLSDAKSKMEAELAKRYPPEDPSFAKE